ncbi:MAG: glycosyltransferase [Hyphomicrobiales bacterium]|nr:glycosyltransferase [Hyphomicrobiales bacterium]
MLQDQSAPLRPDPVDIIRADQTLMTVFALHHALKPLADNLDEDRAAKFLLWFAVEGRHRFQKTVFSPTYLTFLAAPAPPFVTRLAAYVALIRPEAQGLIGDPDRFHAWYYLVAVPELRLGPLLTPPERARLGELHPDYARLPIPLTRLGVYHHLNEAEGPDKPDIATDRGRIAWLRILAARQAEAPSSLGRTAPLRHDPAMPGVNVVGFAEGIFGIGEDSRALVQALERAGAPCTVVKVDISDKIGSSAPSGLNHLYSDRPLYPISIFAMTAFETARLAVEQGPNLFAGRYRIGYWPWELTSLPPEWRGVFDLVDEIWVPSQFLHEVYSRLTDKPIYFMPFYLNPPRVEPFDRETLGIGRDDFVCLTMFDFNSFIARKNPDAAMDAFQAAFPARDGREILIIKTINSHAHPEALAALEARVAADPRFVLLDGAMSRAEVCGLVAAADCFVSLHRAEGFGRVIAEAMLLETIVVATNWSGNTDYLDETNGYPVDFKLLPVQPGQYPFAEGSLWAEPSLQDAAARLRMARDNRSADSGRRDRARALMEARYGLDPVANQIWRRLSEIAGLRRPEAADQPSAIPK